MTWRLVVVLSMTLFFLFNNSFATGRQPAAPPSASLSSTYAPPADSGKTGAADRLSPPFPALISVWGAGSIRPGSILGKLSEGRIDLVGLRYHRRLLPKPTKHQVARNAPTLTYTADAVPFAAVSIPDGTEPDAPSAVQSVAETGLSTSGIGIYPLGLRVGFRPSATVRPFLAGHTGLFYFSKPVPDERGRRTNFAAGVGAGIQIMFTRRMILTLGYRYHHLSNGFRGSINPGLDANLLYLGLGLAP